MANVSSVFKRSLDAFTRLAAVLAGVASITLAVYLAMQTTSLEMPAAVSVKQIQPDAVEKLGVPPQSIRGNIAADSDAHRENARWFLFKLESPRLPVGPTVASFAFGPVSPNMVWVVPKSTANPEHDPSTAIPLEVYESGFGGFVSLKPQPDSTLTLVGKIDPPRPGNPKLKLYRPEDLFEAGRQHSTRTAAITAVFLILACFSAAVAASSRDWTFLVFSGWLVTSLRLVAVNGGWGTDWLFANLPRAYVPSLLTLSHAAYGFFTVALFRSLLKSQLSEFKVRHVLTAFQTGFLFLCITGVLLPDSLYFSTFWILAGSSIALMLASSLWIAVARRDSVAGMMFCTWALTMGGMAAEILFNAGVSSKPLLWVNVETGGIAGALVCAAALAHRLKTEILGREIASQQALKASRELKRNYESMPIGLFACVASGELRIFNPSFQAIFRRVTGREPSPMSCRLQQVIGDAQFDELRTRADSTGRPAVLMAQCRQQNDDVWLQINLKRNDAQFEGTMEDVTKRVIAETALARLVDHDVVTKALNLRGLNESIARAIQLAGRGVSCSLVEVDVDRFKTLNDLYGHIVGDQLLTAMCDLLMQHLTEKDSIARIGDSFRLVIVDRDPAAVLALGNSIQTSASAYPIEVSGRLLSVTTSIGIVSLDPSMQIRDAMAASSQACSDAKRKGRNRVVHLTERDMALHGYLEELKVQENLQDRIDSQRFFLEFQPIVSFKSAFESLNYEVLVRMRGENGSVIPPGRFIPAAERNGQMSLIDRWVVLSTLRWLDQHRGHVQRLGYATINLSGSSLNDARFVDNLFSMIADFPAVMNKLCFEITETVALADQNATRRFAERVHSMGSRVALDDFGAGYTSFTYLREIDADIIKIDGSFVKDINQNPANHAITRMIVDLSHQLGKRCVAEWAEKPDVIATLMQLGVDYGQGFGLARPLPPSALIHASSCGELVMDPNVRALLHGSLSAERLASGRPMSQIQSVLF